MNLNKALTGLTVFAFALTACGGDSKSSSETPKDTVAPVVTTVAPETTPPAPTTTVAETTTTVAVVAVDYSYSYDELGQLVYTDGVFNEPIPEDFNAPYDARNPASPDALTLGELKELKAGAQICVNTTDGNNQTATLRSWVVGIFSDERSDPVLTSMVVLVTTADGIDDSWTADSLGVVPYPDGVTWEPGIYATKGECQS